MLVTGYWVLVTGYWFLVSGYWFLVTGWSNKASSGEHFTLYALCSTLYAFSSYLIS